MKQIRKRLLLVLACVLSAVLVLCMGTALIAHGGQDVYFAAEAAETLAAVTESGAEGAEEFQAVWEEEAVQPYAYISYSAEETNEETGGSMWWLWLLIAIIIVLLLAALALLVLFFLQNKAENRVEKPSEQPLEEATEGGENEQTE